VRSGTPCGDGAKRLCCGDIANRKHQWRIAAGVIADEGQQQRIALQPVTR
jgi:hypothetical protein